MTQKTEITRDVMHAPASTRGPLNFAALPVAALFAFFQRYFTRGLAAAAVKG